MPLHLDYRPEEFEDVAGNTSTVKALQRMLEREDGNKTFLFKGPSGCGKTTLAYITAKEMLGLESINDLATCQDFKEINSSDFSGVATVREIRQQMVYRPAVADCRVFFLDECHKLTADAQEAFLKYTENPPSHVRFIFATTEPGKLKDTFKRRCAVFEVKPLQKKEIASYLEEVAEEEEMELSEEAFETISENCQGSLGIALEALDRCVGANEGEIEEIVNTTLEEKEEAIALARLLINPKAGWNEVGKLLQKLKEDSKDPEGIRRVLLGYATAILVKKPNPRAYLILDCFRDPTYNMGFPAIVLGCYEIVVGD